MSAAGLLLRLYVTGWHRVRAPSPGVCECPPGPPLRDQLHGQQALLQSRRAKWNESMEMPLPEVATTSKSMSSHAIAAVHSFLSRSDEPPATGCSGASRAAERGGMATFGVGCTQ